jgi:hypothetical protein
MLAFLTDDRYADAVVAARPPAITWTTGSGGLFRPEVKPKRDGRTAAGQVERQ